MNINAIAPNISRAFEIADCGRFKVKFIEPDIDDENYHTKIVNAIFLTDFFCQI